jgi:hypothetical protein
MPFGNSIVGDWPENRLLREPLDAAGNRGSGIWRQPAQVPRPAPNAALRSRFPVCRVRRGARKVRSGSLIFWPFSAVTNFRKALSLNLVAWEAILKALVTTDFATCLNAAGACRSPIHQS